MIIITLVPCDYCPLDRVDGGGCSLGVIIITLVPCDYCPLYRVVEVDVHWV